MIEQAGGTIAGEDHRRSGQRIAERAHELDAAIDANQRVAGADLECGGESVGLERTEASCIDSERPLGIR